MRTKNKTPFPFGFKITSRRPPQRDLTFIVRGTFVMRDGEAMSPLRTARDLPAFAKLADVSEALDRFAQGALTADTFADDDEARAGEVLYPSDFADWKKNAEVTLRGHAHAHGRSGRELAVRLSLGDWKKTLVVRRDPDALGQKLPLGWSQTFGGSSFAANPIGTPSPTVVYPSGREDLPASYAPMNAAWSLRADKIGKRYDGDYATKRAPYFAEDFDAGYFHAGAPDQQLEGFLRGDEPLVLEHLVASKRVLETRLPSIRMRVFVRMVSGETRAVPMVLDTVHCDADAELVYLTWRGLCPVAEDDFSDLAFALVAAEQLDSEPLAQDTYTAELDAFAKDPIGLERPDDDDPALKAAAEMAKAGPGAAPSVDPTKPETLTALLAKLMGPAADSLMPAIEQAVSQAMSNPAVQEKLAGPPPKAVAPSGGAPRRDGDPKAGLISPVASVLAATRAAASPNATGEQAAALAHFEALAKEAEGAMTEPGTDPLGPGANLSGRDLSEQDLSGLDLTGADLTGAILSKAMLTGTKLAGAKLAYAVLHDTTLDGADLEGVDLTGADLTGARAAGARFAKAKLDMLVVRNADFSDADLSGASALMVSVSDSKLDGANLAEVAFEQASVDTCSLVGTSLERARLVRCLFRRVDGKGLKLGGAEIERTTFLESDLAGAAVIRARGLMPIFQKSDVSGADFSGVRFVDAVLRELVAHGAKFVGAGLRAASFYRASLADADLSGADLMGADLRKTNLTGARFVDASLYDAKLIESAGTGVSFSGANLTRANFDRSKVVTL